MRRMSNGRFPSPAGSSYFSILSPASGWQRDGSFGFRPLRGLRISQLLKDRVCAVQFRGFRPLRGLRISQFLFLTVLLDRVSKVSVPCGVFVFLNKVIREREHFDIPGFRPLRGLRISQFIKQY